MGGIDEIVTYHYLVAEYFRYSTLDCAEFYALPKTKQADLIWQTLFLDRSPSAKHSGGVLTALRILGLPIQNSLQPYRDYFNSLTLEEHIDNVFSLSGIKEVVMTNDPPFDRVERAFWEKKPPTKIRGSGHLCALIPPCWWITPPPLEPYSGI